MSFTAYKSKIDGKVFYAFPEDYDRILWLNGIDGSVEVFERYFEKLPPDPSTILATATFMTDMPYLDSLKSIYELDRQLNIEAEQDREDKAYQELRKNL